MKTPKWLNLAILAIAIATPILAFKYGDLTGLGVPVAIAAVGAGGRRGIDAFEGATEWINSPPLKASSLRGKVVLVEFWTWSCINWRRQLPYVRAWAEKYRDKGLVVVGVHTPEFEFEKDVPGIRRATKEMDVPFPVVVD